MNKLEGATIRALIRDNMPKFPKLLSKIAGNAISEGLNFKSSRGDALGPHPLGEWDLHYNTYSGLLCLSKSLLKILVGTLVLKYQRTPP